MRFLGELANANVIEPSHILLLFEQFVDVTSEENVPQDRIDFYMFLVLATLPWVGSEFSKSNGDGLSRLLTRVEVYMTGRYPRGCMFDPYLADSINISDRKPSDTRTDKLAQLWKQIVALQGDEWITRSTLRPYVHFHSKLSTAENHRLPFIKIAPHV